MVCVLFRKLLLVLQNVVAISKLVFSPDLHKVIYKIEIMLNWYDMHMAAIRSLWEFCHKVHVVSLSTWGLYVILQSSSVNSHSLKLIRNVIYRYDPSWFCYIICKTTFGVGISVNNMKRPSPDFGMLLYNFDGKFGVPVARFLKVDFKFCFSWFKHFQAYSNSL